MEEKREKHQEQPTEGQDSSPVAPKSTDSREEILEEKDKKTETSRPRITPDSERVIRVGRERAQKRETRGVMRARGIGTLMRPTASASGVIQREEKKKVPESQIPVTEEITRKVGIVEDREIVKWAAWLALFVSLVTLFLMALYSRRDFGPEFEFRDLEITQKQLVTDVNDLKYNTRLEKIRSAVINAHFQLLVRKDYATAEAILAHTPQDMNELIDSLPVEKKVEPRQILSDIERTIREIRRGPSSLDERLRKVLSNLEKL
jgi:hypothetical protein